MAISTTDDLILKVHTGPDGRVWHLDGDRLPESTGRPVGEYVKDAPALMRADRVRFMGVPANAELAMHLFSRKVHGDLAGLEVCSPLACETSARREKPESVLFDLRKWAPAIRPSLGGWHQFENLDYVSYAISAGLQRKADAAHLVRFLKDHPVWYALAGVPHLNLGAVCELVGGLLDPRFYVDLQEPDRLSKLEAFLGLDPKIAACEGRSPEPTRQHDRYRTALRCWKNDDPGKETARVMPELFLRRTYHEAGGGWKGDLKATKRFVHYLRHCWLDALYPVRYWAEPLFAPEHFFTEAKETVEWYRGQLKRKR